MSASELPDPSQTPPVLSLQQEFPDHAALIDRLRHRDQSFRRIASYYESLTLNIHAIESGREEASESFVTMLRNQRDQTRGEILTLLGNAPPY